MASEATPDASVGLESAREKLRQVWGYDDFRPLQEEAIEDVLAGRDSVVVLPTGGGKSLCYQIPALVRGNMAIVVSPLISLMKDQVDALRSNGVAAAWVNSTQSTAEKAEVAEQIRRGGVALLYLAPERLLAPKTLSFLKQQDVSFIAIDEAHCVSQWGHDFRPEYRQLGTLKDHFPAASLHAFTATASQRVREDIAAQLGLRNHHTLVGSFDRPNLVYRMLRQNQKVDQILDVVGKNAGESGIVYAITRREVEELTSVLKSKGIKAAGYHAGMSDEQRRSNQDAFIREEIDVVVATVAFGMGIDKANVRYVIHAGMPQSIEHYQQESGRAGRDGLPSQCILLHSPRDLMTWKRILENSSDTNYRSAMDAVESMGTLCSSVRCRHASLVEYFGQEYDSDNCAACDVCLGEIDTVDDALVLSQKILSCVVRLKERFGTGHTVKVLVGSREKRILDFQHDQLSTYGLLSQYPATVVRTWIDQLISQGFARRVGEYQTLQLTDAGRRLLKGDAVVQLTREPEGLKSRGSNSRSRGGAGDDEESWRGVDRDLFEHLRARRKQLAAERRVPAYVIFGDRVLREMARVRPSSIPLMGQISGIGESKLQDLGPLFLEAMDQFAQTHGLTRDQPGQTRVIETKSHRSKPQSSKSRSSGGSATAELAATLFAQGCSVAEVAEQTGRAESTTHGYLQNYLRDHRVTDPSAWLTTDQVARVEEELRKDRESQALRPIYEALDEQVSYHEIRIIAACLRNRQEEEQESSGGE